MSALTTHVLDVSRGIPARGMTIELWSLDQSRKLKTVKTNDDGRVDAPLLAVNEMAAGNYELIFFVGDLANANSSIAFRCDSPFPIQPPNIISPCSSRRGHIARIAGADFLFQFLFIIEVCGAKE
jgi:hypothetical protein